MDKLMGIWVIVLLCAALAPMQQALAMVLVGRATYDFNFDWRFKRDDVKDGQKTGRDDSGWAKIRLPHDWGILANFDPKGDGRTGALPWRGVGWYRKTFTLPAGARGNRVYLDFDGAMALPKVYVNGEYAGGWDYGYNSFRVDATDYVKFGAENVVAVRCDTTKIRSRWYPGGGLYRNVSLTLCEPVHIAQWGVYITTPDVTDARASVRIGVDVENHDEEAVETAVKIDVLNPDGKSVAAAEQQAAIPPGESHRFDRTTTIENPKRWDIEHAHLYTARITVRRDGRTTDTYDQSFGIRTFKWTDDDGFHLNGRRVQLKGVNLHHGHGPLGAAFYRRAMRRQIEILKDMGVNAIRTSHNVPAPQLPELCDEMGIILWNEAFDKWERTAHLFDQSKFAEFMSRQFTNFIRRDRNHPCVFTWSIGNEIRAGGVGLTTERIRTCVELVHKLDPTRPASLGHNNPSHLNKENLLGQLDVLGWNYGAKYTRARDRFPKIPQVYSESSSAFTTRGFYRLPHPKGKTDWSDDQRCDSYDLVSAKWGDIPDVEFYRMERHKYVAGEFVWSGFDYLGEPTPYGGRGGGKSGQNARSSYFGIVDLVGLPKDRYYLYRSHWRPEATTVHILPHWNWPERKGKNVPVYVYTNGDSAELFVNGKSLGRRSKSTVEGGQTGADLPGDYYDVVDRYRLRWEKVTYQPGELRALAYKDGEKIAEATVRTAGKPTGLRVTPEWKTIKADGYDLAYFRVAAVDADGNLCPNADNRVMFEVEGPADIMGAGNGDQTEMDSLADKDHPLFHGLAVVILRSRPGEKGKIRLTAEAKGLPPASAGITAE